MSVCAELLDLFPITLQRPLMISRERLKVWNIDDLIPLGHYYTTMMPYKIVFVEEK